MEIAINSNNPLGLIQELIFDNTFLLTVREKYFEERFF